MEAKPEQEGNLVEEKTKRPVLEISERTKAELTALFAGKEWNGEKLPPLFLKLFSGPHESADDAKGIKPLLKDSDIYAPELFGWDSGGVALFREASDGTEAPAMGDDFYDEILKQLSEIKKPVMFLDVSKEEGQSFPELYEEESFEWKLKRASYEKALHVLSEGLVNSVPPIVIHREEYMIEHFAESVRNIISENPELLNKKDIHILMSLGDGHSAIYHFLKQIGGENVSREYKSNPLFGFITEIIRRATFDKEITEDIKEKALCEFILSQGLNHLIYRVTKDSCKVQELLRYYASQFTPEEIQSLYYRWKSRNTTATEASMAFLKSKNIPFPENAADLDEILKNTLFEKNLAIKNNFKEKNESDQ